ncbi:MAG: hypothetical protein DRP74_08685 [Candidatus Omnitrophota bacterium]|nr:MAG: hypothetical protein DRP74_08685 [Candidatus Omnitrophota bacterium]
MLWGSNRRLQSREYRVESKTGGLLTVGFKAFVLLTGIIVFSALFLNNVFAGISNYIIYYAANDGGPNWRILSANVYPDRTERQLAIDLGPAGSLDAAHAFSQSVLIEDNGTYVMYYAGHDGSNWRILKATSVDGVKWVKQGVCLNLGAKGAFDSEHVVYPCVLKDGRLYKMWYTAYDGKGHWRIGYAESQDGTIFKNRQIALDIGPAQALDAVHVHTPVVIKSGGIYIMYYAGYGGNPLAWRILRATSSDGINWSKQGLVLDIGQKQGPDAQNLLPGSVIFEEGVFKMWYWAHGDIWKILYAQSYNGVDWEKKGIFLDAGPVRSLDFRGLAVPAVYRYEEKK